MKEKTDIKFYNAIEFAQLVIKTGPKGVMKDKNLRELFYCHPLMMREVLSRKVPMAIGKIDQQDHPFDVVFINEDELADFDLNQPINLKDPIFVQLKELVDYGRKIAMTVDEWIAYVQSKIDEVKASVKIEPYGVLHFHNKIMFSKINGPALEAKLKTIKLPSDFPYKQVSLSIEVMDTSGTAKGIHTWQLHPNFWPIGSIEHKRDFYELRKLYGLES